MDIQFYSENSLDFSKIASTFEKSFNQTLDEKYWKWRFLNNPMSDKIYISYCLDGDTLAGYYAVSPANLNINGVTKKIAHSNMTMTHPDYQGRGIFRLLSTRLFEELKRASFIGVYGYANHNSHFGFRKHMDWIDLSVLNNFNIIKTNLKKKSTAYCVEIQEISSVNFDVTKWYTNKSISFERSQIYLNWRFVKNPNTYRVLHVKDGNDIIANIIFKEFVDSLDIMEVFLSCEDTNLQRLWASVCTFIFDSGFNQINIWSNLYSEEHLMLEKLGFQEKDFSTYFGLIPFASTKEIEHIRDWHYRFADSDVY